jgi:DNA-binding NtrC family response regulator
VVELCVPPLRERGEDVPLLAQHFLSVHGARYAKRNLRFSAGAERLLRAHRWPGNVRELRNVVEQAVLLALHDAAVIDHLNISSPAGNGASVQEAPAESSLLHNAERALLLQALDSTEWNVTRAAKLLGVSRDTLRYRIEKFQLSQQP